MCLKVSSDLPERNKTRPENFGSSSLIDGILLSPMWKGTSSELPDWMDNDRDLLGLICIPIVIMNLTEELSVRTEI